MDILSSGYLRSILCLIGTTTVQMFFKEKALTLYQGNKWLPSRQPNEEFKKWMKNSKKKWNVDHGKHKKTSSVKAFWCWNNLREGGCYRWYVFLWKPWLSIRNPWLCRRKGVCITDWKKPTKPKQNPPLNAQSPTLRAYKESLPTSLPFFPPSHFWLKFLQ